MLKEGLELLKRYEIPVPEYWINDFPTNIQFPVVVKADLNHKSEKGAVVKDVFSYDHLQRVVDQLKHKFPGKDIIIQKQITGNLIETIIGIKRDPTFDYFVLFGLGGTITELLRDFIILVPPFDKRDFLRQIENLRLKKLLFGFRNYPKIDLNKVYEVIAKLSKAFEEDDLKEIEINPLICKETEVFAVDVRFFK
jgi:succinyl-CoA synthetase beta subunit